MNFVYHNIDLINTVVQDKILQVAIDAHNIFFIGFLMGKKALKPVSCPGVVSEITFKLCCFIAIPNNNNIPIVVTRFPVKNKNIVQKKFPNYQGYKKYQKECFNFITLIIIKGKNLEKK